MTYTFKNYNPGVYFVISSIVGDTVGSIRKQAASKWVLYDVMDKPIAVGKTLSGMKATVDCYFNPVKNVGPQPTLEPIEF